MLLIERSPATNNYYIYHINEWRFNFYDSMKFRSHKLELIIDLLRMFLWTNILEKFFYFLFLNKRLNFSLDALKIDVPRQLKKQCF